MKKLKFLAIALIASFCMVACNDDPEPEPVKPNNPPTPEEQDSTYMDLSTINFMDNGWILTEVSCEEIPSDLLVQYQAAMFRNDGSLYIDPYGDPNAIDIEYQGWVLNFVLNNEAKWYFDVTYFKRNSNELCVSTDQDEYTGKLIYTQDKEKVYVSFEGESYREGAPAKFKAYKLKSRFKI